MKIKKIELTNFRNIKHIVYDLGDVSCFVGKNHIGKTNSLLGAYWLFTNKILDNSSNDISLKPLDNPKEKVSVKLTIESNEGIEHTLERTYQEHWSRTRGSDKLVLDGHDTTFIIDGIVQKKLAIAQKEIDAITSIDNSNFSNAGLEKYQALMNPFYLSEQVEWKNLRKLIIDIVGDVTNEDVFVQDAKLRKIETDLIRYNYAVEKLITFLTQQITQCNDSKIGIEAKIDLLEKTEDLSAEEMQNLEDRQFELKSALKDASVQKDNPLVKAKEEEVKKLETECKDIFQKEKQAYMEEIQKEHQEKNHLYNEYTIKDVELGYVKDRLSDLKKNVAEIEYKITCKSNDIERLNIDRQRLLSEYQTIKTESFKELESKVCPHCGGVLNADEIEEHKSFWVKQHKEKLEKNIASGKATALKIESTKLEKEELNNSLLAFKSELEKVEKEMQEKAKIVEDAKNDWMNKDVHSMQSFFPSKDYSTKYEEYEKAENELKQLIQMHSSETAQDELKAKINVELASIKDKLGIHYQYLSARKQIEELNFELDNIATSLVEFETKKEYAKLFNKTKLELLDARLNAHFGNEVKFVLVKNNIAEGSWDNVCYPLICGTDIPFKNGSRSEKVLTGIKIIEVIKRELGINDMPIFIDEIAELDSDSLLKLRELSKSQIIATRVDDSFSELTLVINRR